MTLKISTGLVALALGAAALFAVPAMAADLGYGDEHIRGGYMPAMPVHGPVSPCYVRGDIGGSFSSDPTITWPITNGGNLVTDKVTETAIDSTWLLEGGYGCGSGSRGFRGELVLGYRGERSVNGRTGPWLGTEANLHSGLTSYTAMANVFYDFGMFRGMVPYLGVGIGAAYHHLNEVYFTDNPALSGIIGSDNDLAFAWNIMGGVGYQISDRAVLDFGYRYMDMGTVASARYDQSGTNVNPKVVVDDIAAHEFKIGLRYHLGGPSCCSQPMPFK